MLHLILVVTVRVGAPATGVFVIAAACPTATTSHASAATAPWLTSAAAEDYSTTDHVQPTSSGMTTTRSVATPVPPAGNVQYRSVLKPSLFRDLLSCSYLQHCV